MAASRAKPSAAAAELSRSVQHAFTVDVEDYFQVEAFKNVIAQSDWPDLRARVAENTDRILALLDAAQARGTFFVLGWVAERYPSVVRNITAAGHEIASHGYAHERATSQSPSELRADVRRARQLLEDCSGSRVRGYRAPTFSISRDNWWAYDVLAEEGYEYSSSIYPIAHDLYGMPSAPRAPFHPLKDSPFLEIPISTVRLLDKNFPCGGGGYFRLLPYVMSRWCIRRASEHGRQPCVFYCHPWEFDPEQPRISAAPLKSRVRHYLNLRAMEPRVSRLLHDFSWSRMDAVFLGAN